MSMNWVAVNIQTANEEHRISKPEYVHVWVSPGCWFNMPQVRAWPLLCLASVSCFVRLRARWFERLCLCECSSWI